MVTEISFNFPDYMVQWFTEDKILKGLVLSSWGRAIFACLLITAIPEYQEHAVCERGKGLFSTNKYSISSSEMEVKGNFLC